MRCPKCGEKIKSDATFCTRCGQRLDSANLAAAADDSERQTVQRPRKKILAIGIVVAVCLIYFFGFRCKAGICLLPRSIGGEYCIAHTCKWSDCKNKKAADSNYCYTHRPSASTGHNYSYTPEKGEDVLKFSDIELSSNSSYTICNARITNNGRKTYTFVEVKGKFATSSGVVIDTDWTYAVGSEGLAPGESATFRLSVDKDWSITRCTLELLDYDKE